MSVLHKYRMLLKTNDRFGTLREVPASVQKEERDTRPQQNQNGHCPSSDATHARAYGTVD